MYFLYTGNGQKEANSLIEDNNLGIHAVEDFQKAAQAVTFIYRNVTILCICCVPPKQS